VKIAPAIHTEALLYHRTFDGHTSAGYSRQYEHSARIGHRFFANY
jgi:hypothetical protein